MVSKSDFLQRSLYNTIIEYLMKAVCKIEVSPHVFRVLNAYL